MVLQMNMDADLRREARVLAAEEGRSISALLTDRLETMGRERRTFDKAWRRALARLRKGLGLQWTAPKTRDELHEREVLRRREHYAVRTRQVRRREAPVSRRGSSRSYGATGPESSVRRCCRNLRSTCVGKHARRSMRRYAARSSPTR